MQLPRARLHGGFFAYGRVTPTLFPGCPNAASSEHDLRVLFGMMNIQSTEIHQSATCIKAEHILVIYRVERFRSDSGRIKAGMETQERAAGIAAGIDHLDYLSIAVKLLFTQYYHT